MAPELRVFRGNEDDPIDPLPARGSIPRSQEVHFYQPPHSIRAEQLRTTKILGIAGGIALGVVLLVRGCQNDEIGTGTAAVTKISISSK